MLNPSLPFDQNAFYFSDGNLSKYKDLLHARLYNPVKMSFGRCVVHAGFFDRFYQIFLASNPIIANKFANTDLTAQKKVLKQGLNMVMMYADGQILAKKAVGRIRDSHSQGRLNIPPGMYGFWETSLMKTIAEFDPQFSPDLETQWRAVLKPALEVIKGGYMNDRSARLVAG
ncbi:MAG: globin [Deltaproteobacteria bacterium]|nr:globin [Deltaproteobacteria bacterium]